MVDTTDRFEFSGLRSLPPRSSSIKGPTEPSKIIQVTLVLAPEQTPEAHPASLKHRNFLASAPQKRQAMTAEDVAAIFSPDQKHINEINSFCKAHGLRVVNHSDFRNDITLEGSVQNMNEAFGVELNDYQHQEGICRSHDNELTLPESLRDVVIDVIGLDDVPISGPNASSQTGQVADAVVEYSPRDLAKRYRFPDGDGHAQRIAILNFGPCGYHKSDIELFFREVLGTQPPVIKEFSIGGLGNDPLPYETLQKMTRCFNSKDDPREQFTQEELIWGKATLETTMDIEIAAGVANAAEICLYFAPNNARGWYDSIYSALETEGNGAAVPTVISASWGASEASWRTAKINSLELALEKARLMQVNVCCSSGDLGSVHEHPPSPMDVAKVNYPASSPRVLACGGTSLTSNSQSGNLDDTAWKCTTQFGIEASGGGISGYFDLPDFQQDASVPAHSDLDGAAWLHGDKPADFRGRGIPDIAAFADVGYRVAIGGENYVNGGTSATTPLIAGLLVLLTENLGRRFGSLNELVYRAELQPALTAVVVGDNKVVDTAAAYFKAHDGWNGCCGVGVPDGEKLLKCLRQIQPDLASSEA